MRTTLTFIAVCICTCAMLRAQSAEGITLQQQKEIAQKVETLALAFKQQMIKNNESAATLEFKLDTFRVERWAAACLELDESDQATRSIELERGRLYDSLLNKYYHKLLSVLKADDKKVLVQAQKNWLGYRDSEQALLLTVSKDEYSGGGTIQRLINASEYTSMVEERTIALFNHYQRATQSE